MFDKIKIFFKKIFKKNEIKLLSPMEQENIIVEEKKSTMGFSEQLSKFNLVSNLRRDFEEGLIKEEDLTVDEYNTLIAEYEDRIGETKKTISKYENRIESIKLKVLTSN